jgi:hypothetical protein
MLALELQLQIPGIAPLTQQQHEAKAMLLPIYSKRLAQDFGSVDEFVELRSFVEKIRQSATEARQEAALFRKFARESREFLEKVAGHSLATNSGNSTKPSGSTTGSTTSIPTSWFQTIMNEKFQTIMNDRKLLDRLRATSFNFLSSDLDLAMTLMDSASIITVEAAAQQTRRNARAAYDAVLRLLAKVELNETQRRQLEERMATLKARLEGVGQEF